MSEDAHDAVPAGRLRRLTGSVWMRVAVTGGLLVAVGVQIDWSRLADRISEGNPEDFAIAVLLVVTALVIGAWRWHLLLRDAGVVLTPASLFRVYAVSTFSNTFLPTSVGGDVTRVLLVARRGPMLARVATTVVVDRIGGLVGLVGLAWLALAVDPGEVPSGSKAFLACVTVLLLGGVAAVVAVTLGRGIATVRRFVPERLGDTVRELRATLHGYTQAPMLMLALLVSSVVFQALVALQLVMLARAIDIDLAFSTASVALALVTLVTLVPVSIGGFGVREGSYVVLLSSASIAATDATLISVLSVAALFLASLPGAYLLATHGLAPAGEMAPQ